MCLLAWLIVGLFLCWFVRWFLCLLDIVLAVGVVKSCSQKRIPGYGGDWGATGYSHACVRLH